MVCIFCVAIFATGIATITGATVDLIQAKLKKKASTPVKRVADTESVAKLEFGMKAAGKTVPVALTIFKDHKRVRIQVMSHEIPRGDADKLQNQLADLLDLKIIDRSTAEDELLVREAFTEAPSKDAPPTDPRAQGPPQLPERPR